MRLLQIDGDGVSAMSIELMLKAEGMNVFSVGTGEEGAELAKIYDYDLLLLEMRLPDTEGLRVIRDLRLCRVKTPIIVVSHVHDIETKVKCFGAGADDYITKPFHRDELVMRIRTVLRRTAGLPQLVFRNGDLQVNLDAKTVDVGHMRVHLTGKEYQMLELMSLRSGTTISKEMFMNHLYGGMDEPELKIIDVFICKLRKKLRSCGVLVETVWGRGYRMRPPASEPVAASA